MNRTQEDTLTMWTTTNAVLNKNTEIWSEAKAFANAVAIFRKIRLEIDPEANMQRTDIPGITEEKTQERIRLNALAKQMALNIEAYAFNKKDIILQRQFTFATSYFNKLRDNTITSVANAIYDKAVKLGKELEDYGVGAKQLTNLQSAIKEYEVVNSGPREAMGEVKTATVSIAGKLKAGKAQLELMDKLVGNFAEDHPKFVALFINARVVINLGSHKKPKNPPPDTPEKPE